VGEEVLIAPGYRLACPFRSVCDSWGSHRHLLDKGGTHLRRESLSLIAYSEKLHSSTISATLQSTDRHHGIVDQKRSHFRLDS
jgi:hypothetical protein